MVRTKEGSQQIGALRRLFASDHIDRAMRAAHRYARVQEEGQLREVEEE